MEIAIALLVVCGFCFCFRTRERARVEIAGIVERRLTETDENHVRFRIAEMSYANERDRRLLGDGGDGK